MCCPRRLIVMGVSSDGGRNLIGRRTETDRVADGIRSDSERKPIGWRTGTDWVAGAFKGVHLSQVHQQSYQVSNKAVKCTKFLSVVNILAWMVHLRQVHPPKRTSCMVGVLLALASGKAERRQVHPLKNAEEQK